MKKLMIGIILKRAVIHSNNASPNELRLRRFLIQWRNLGAFSRKKYTFLRSVHFFIRAHIHSRAWKNSTPKKGRLAPHTDKYGVKNASLCYHFSFFARGDAPAWSVCQSPPSPRLLRQGVRLAPEKKR